jgi:parallel beta-helix repeat protein
VNISADDVSISGLTIEPNRGHPTGIAVYKNYTSPDFWNMKVIQNVTIFNNNIKNIGWAGIFGIRLEQGNIYGNNIENCDGYGIYLLVSSNNIITNNFITNCSVDGIIIDGLWSLGSIIMNYRNPKPKNNIISQNTITFNGWGIEVNSGPVNTKIYENNIIGNHELGIRIVFAYQTEINRNNFIENSQNAYFMAIQFTQLLKNSWDKNYWGEPKNSPVAIPGSFYLIPLKVFDWHPAKEPYEIP